MKKTLFAILVLVGVSACSGPKQLSYLQDLQNGESLAAQVVDSYQLLPGDQVTIRVSSYDRSAIAPFNIQDANLNDIPFIVDEQGRLAYPGLGAITVKGMTVGRLSALLQDHVSKMAKGAVVRVELVSAFVSVLGEVEHPVRIKWCQPGLTLLEALTDAGDLLPNASRRLTILRKQADGNLKTIIVDLRNKNVLTGEGWQLQPGDIVYVAPRYGRLNGRK